MIYLSMALVLGAIISTLVDWWRTKRSDRHWIGLLTKGAKTCQRQNESRRSLEP